MYKRIACLSTEAVETIYLLGAQESLAGISGFTVYPPQARKGKPKVSGLSSAKIERILAVEPDLLSGFSALQAGNTQELGKRSIEVHVYNHRDIAGKFRMIRSVGALVNRNEEAAKRIIADPREVIRRAPDIIVGLLVREEVRARASARAPGMGLDSRGPRGSTVREQVGRHPGSWPLRDHARPRANGGDYRRGRVTPRRDKDADLYVRGPDNLKEWA